MHSGNERRSVLRVSCGNSTPALQMQKSVFNQMAQTIQIFVVIPLILAIALRRDYHIHPLRDSFFNNCVAVIPFIAKQPLCRKPINQGTSLFTIMDGTRCNKYSDRHTIRIHGKMYFGVEPPFVRSISWLPPAAPAACG